MEDSHVIKYKMSERYRSITEATSTLKTPLEQRRKYLAGVEKHRGKKAREELEQEMISSYSLPVTDMIG